LSLSDLNRVFAGRPPIDIADIGEPLSAQQLLREILRGKADGPGDLYKAHSCCFGGSFCGRHSRVVQEAGRARQCYAADEPASGLDDRHWNLPSLWRSSLKLAFEFVEKAPISVLRNDLGTSDFRRGAHLCGTNNIRCAQNRCRRKFADTRLG